MSIKLNVAILVAGVCLSSLLLFNCGKSDGKTSDGGGVGRYQAQLVFPEEVYRQGDLSDINCEASDIAVIEFNFILDNKQYGPHKFACIDHKAAIFDVPAGRGIAVEVFADDVGGNALYEGSTVVDIIRDQVTTGEIAMHSSDPSTETDMGTGSEAASDTATGASTDTGSGTAEDTDPGTGASTDSVADVDSDTNESRFTLTELEMTFLRIPAGVFSMGSPDTEEDRDTDEEQHLVRITQDYFIQETEVTQNQWRQVMAGTDLENPSHFQDCDNCPVEQVSWSNIVNMFLPRLNARYAGRYNFRLPTEAEWEYAARAGTTTPYYFGETLNPSQANYDGTATIVVGSFAPNRRGLFDMHGNVVEWCSDWYGPYEFASAAEVVEDPPGPAGGEFRVLRGGGMGSFAGYCRSAGRDASPSGSRYSYVGFRLAARLVSR